MIAGLRHTIPDSLVSTVRRHALATPEAPAVVSTAGNWTYHELWQRVSVIAAALRETRVGPGDRVAVCADRTRDVVATMLAVMASRASYVPVDRTNPAERVAAVVAGARPVALVHDGVAEPPAFAGPVLDVSQVPNARVPALGADPRPDETAYVVFTSGSTGRPKGVLVEHRNLANYLGWVASLVGDFREATGTGSPLFASLGFDLALTTLWVPLFQGSSVTVAAGIWDSRSLFGGRHAFVKMTPSHARFFETRPKPPRYSELTDVLMFGGEPLDPVLLRSFGDRLDGVRLINHYGPTETTIGACAYQFTARTMPDLPSVPIGVPVWNTRVYVVDEGLRPVPPGTAGELVVAGAAVTAGYLDPAPAGGFIDESDVGGSVGRAYRTGDVVEELPDRTLLYRGRADEQLKVNGHRVEQGELRHHVSAVPGVATVAVGVVRGTVEQVELFVVPTRPGGDAAALAETVRGRLARIVPDAVVPARVHVVPRLVADANGKCDLRATRALLDGGQATAG